MTIDAMFDVLLRATEQIKYPTLPELDRLTVSVDQRTFATVAIAQFQDPFKIQGCVPRRYAGFHAYGYGAIRRHSASLSCDLGRRID